MPCEHSMFILSLWLDLLIEESKAGASGIPRKKLPGCERAMVSRALELHGGAVGGGGSKGAGWAWGFTARAQEVVASSVVWPSVLAVVWPLKHLFLTWKNWSAVRYWLRAGVGQYIKQWDLKRQRFHVRGSVIFHSSWDKTVPSLLGIPSGLRVSVPLLLRGRSLIWVSVFILTRGFTALTFFLLLWQDG